MFLRKLKARRHCGVTKKYAGNSRRFPLKQPHQRTAYNINKEGKAKTENVIKVKQLLSLRQF